MYICDNQRHLVCIPYTVDNLHEMAAKLGIGRHWFHKDHYDIPKKMITWITTSQAVVVSPRKIVEIIGRQQTWLEEQEERVLMDVKDMAESQIPKEIAEGNGVFENHE